MSANQSPKPATTFAGRAKQLNIQHLAGEPARLVLQEAWVQGADAMSAPKCTETAAALAWARFNIDNDAVWTALPGPLLKKLKDLYNAPVNPTWPPEQALQSIRGSVRATMPVAPPPPPPVPGAAGGAPPGPAHHSWPTPDLRLHDGAHPAS